MSERTPHIEPTLGATGSLAADYFERLYEQADDPWEFETSTYEAEKYAATLAALPRKQYAHGLELGCSIGVLTRQLAGRCDRLLATDVSTSALARAKRRCADRPEVAFEERDLTSSFPEGRFDLIVVSEVGYYLSSPDLLTLRENIRAALSPHGHLLLVHYTGETNYPQTAACVHGTFLAWADRSWRRLSGANFPSYRLDLLERI